MRSIHEVIKRSTDSTPLLGDRRGLTTVEYVIVLVLIAVVGIGVWSTFGQTIHGKIKAANGQLRDHVNAGY
jgi:Flp pilus assembly pilin Flp